MDQRSFSVLIIAIICLGIGLFFLLRELWCWYIKTNEILDNLDRTHKLISENDQALNDLISENNRLLREVLYTLNAKEEDQE
jgi:hypothetical protein